MEIDSVLPTDDRTPSLSRQSPPPSAGVTGREPVISGQGSRLLADRRGAYETGNLNQLLCHMSEPQLGLMREWVGGILRRKVLTIMPLIDKYFADSPDVLYGASLLREGELPESDEHQISQVCLDVRLNALQMLSRRFKPRQESAAFFACYALSSALSTWNNADPPDIRPGMWYAASPYPALAHHTEQLCKTLITGVQYVAAAVAIDGGYRYRINSTGVVEFPSGPRLLKLLSRSTKRTVLRGAYLILNRRDDYASSYQRI